MKKGSLIKSTAIVMGAALISRGVGFFRDILITNNFGAGVNTDAYKLAASIPDTIFMIIGLAISTAFLPMLSRIKVNKGKTEMYKFANNIINILFIISLVIFILTSIFPQNIVSMLTSEKTNLETIELTTKLTKIILVNLLFLPVNACFTAMLQIDEDFIIPSVLGLFFNLPIIIYLLLFKEFNVYGLTIANLIGNFLRLVVQVPSLYKNGYRYKLFIDLKDERVKRILILILPVVISAGANSINLVVDKNIVSGIDDGAVTTLDNAQLLITFINTMVTTSIATVVFPVISNRLSEGKHEEFLKILSKTVVYLAILLVPITAGMFVYGGDLIRIIFVHGKFTKDAAILASSAFFGYVFGIFFTGLRDILNATLFSMGLTKITARNGVIGVVINVTLSVILYKPYGVMGVALASSISMIVTSVLLLKNITKVEGQLKISILVNKLSKIIIATVIMAIAVIGMNILTGALPSIISLILGASIGVVVYFIIVYKLKIDEVNELISFAINKVKS
jgi:putative peptidoglycan lipid II flippase